MKLVIDWIICTPDENDQGLNVIAAYKLRREAPEAPRRPGYEAAELPIKARPAPEGR